MVHIKKKVNKNIGCTKKMQDESCYPVWGCSYITPFRILLHCRSPTHSSPCLCLRCSFRAAVAWCMSPQPLGWPDSLFYPPITQQPEVHLTSNLWKLPTLFRCPWNWLPACAHFCGSVWPVSRRSPALWRSWLCSHSCSARLSEEPYDV